MDEISIIIPTYYRYDHLRELLVQLLDQTRLPDEIIVADQTPLEDRPEKFYSQFDDKIIRVMDIFPPSLTRPRNIAAKSSTGNILLFLDDDIQIKKDFVESHLTVINDEKVDVLNGATTRHEELPSNFPWDVRPLDPVRYFLAAPNYKWDGMMLGVSSCNFSIRKDTFLAVGGFDENLPRMVDFELGYRLFRSGAKIYYSQKPFARHLRGSGGSRKNPKKHNKLVSALYIHKKHFPGWITRQFILKNILNKSVIFQPWLLMQIWKANKNANILMNKKNGNP